MAPSSRQLATPSGRSFRNRSLPSAQPLQFNGGFGYTHALTPASAALNAADPAQCHPQDDRQVERPFGTGCDIGAYELSGLFVPLLFGD